MNLREGRIGVGEGVSIAAISMCTSGLFNFDAKNSFAGGSASYITLPVGGLLALAFFILVLEVMRRSGARNLSELILTAFGDIGGVAATLVVTLCLLVAAYSPLSGFVQAMHGLFFNGVGYGKLAMYVFPTVLFTAWLGFETIGRTAKCFALLLLVILAVSVLTASSEFETYRLYPFPGSTPALLLRETLAQTGAFLPALMSLLITCTGLQGARHAKKAGVTAALVSVVICAAAQLAVSLAFTYTELGDLFMPLFRINNLKSLETHLLRMDKLAYIAWLSGGMLTGAFYIYAASLLFSQVCGVRDIRPVLGSNTLIVALLMLIDFEGLLHFLPNLRAANSKYGFIFLAAPIAAAAFIGAVCRKPEKNAAVGSRMSAE